MVSSHVSIPSHIQAFIKNLKQYFVSWSWTLTPAASMSTIMLHADMQLLVSISAMVAHPTNIISLLFYITNKLRFWTLLSNDICYSLLLFLLLLSLVISLMLLSFITVFLYEISCKVLWNK